MRLLIEGAVLSLVCILLMCSDSLIDIAYNFLVK
ncbi:hypothetical protein F862_gp088 [Vibrio phage vB_VpaS_MAR10]|uniref:Uncharacterized protein n=1 Tax=Vibrio phage vB_VpaS_MAR10 TaxID=1229755 RepID=K7RVT1_9CAUD|nr:hypothetical protein F862_gp088 [Vibrio phage vB_VpaS_MAR10]AFV81320.1 hypothetical protein MAR10_084B [Vibrio phage vB_VpaS_MAR10]